ncbi:MAG: transposase [Deltaproteobacteria bacterium]|nr:transposase [Deltaproteobacteria bacterium]
MQDSKGGEEREAARGGQIIKIEEERLHRHLDRIVRGTVVETLSEFYREAAWQRCAVHFYRNVFTKVPKARAKEVAAMLKAIHVQEDREAAEEKIAAVVKKLRKMKLASAAALVEESAHETLSCQRPPAKPVA